LKKKLVDTVAELKSLLVSLLYLDLLCDVEKYTDGFSRPRKLPRALRAMWRTSLRRRRPSHKPRLQSVRSLEGFVL
jgi:hypothetical protein